MEAQNNKAARGLIIAFFVVVAAVVCWIAWPRLFPLGIGVKLPPGVEIADVKLPKEASDYTIKVSGTTGASFKGFIQEIQPNSRSTSREFEGTVPATYEARGAVVQGMFMLSAGEGFLRVEVLSDGEVVQQRETAKYQISVPFCYPDS